MSPIRQQKAFYCQVAVTPNSELDNALEESEVSLFGFVPDRFSPTDLSLFEVEQCIYPF